MTEINTTSTLLSTLQQGFYSFKDLSTQTDLIKYLPVQTGKASLYVDNTKAILISNNNIYINNLTDLTKDNWITISNLSDITNKVSTALGDYYDKEETDQKLLDASSNAHVDLSGYVQTAALATTLADYSKTVDADKKYESIADLTKSLADYVKSADLNTTLQSYLKISDFNTDIADYTKTTDLNQLLQNYEKVADLTKTLSNYSTTDDIDAKDATTLSTAKSYTDSQITTAVKNLVNGAPAALDTLNEIAEKLSGDDANIADVLAKIATKADSDTVYNKTDIDTKLADLASTTDLQNAIANSQTNFKYSADVSLIDGFDTIPTKANMTNGVVAGLYRTLKYSTDMTVSQFQPANTTALFESVNGGDWNMISGSLAL